MTDAALRIGRAPVSAKIRESSLADVETLLVGHDRFQTGIVKEMLHGFGIYRLATAESASHAMDIMSRTDIDLCVSDYHLPDKTGVELVRWIRRQKNSLRFMTAIVLAGHTYKSKVLAARDGGANCVLRKPISAQTLFDHIVWSAGTRKFVDSSVYIGPDRRFHEAPPEDGIDKRGSGGARPPADSDGSAWDVSGDQTAETAS
jgi:CheY-like chemotaxis protein